MASHTHTHKKNTCPATRAGLFRVPLPAHCQSAGIGSLGFSPAAPAERSYRTRVPRRPQLGAHAPPPASRPRRGRGGREGGAAARGTQSPRAQEPTPPRTTLCLWMYWGYRPEPARKGRSWVERGKRAGIGHLGTLQVQAGERAPVPWVPASSLSYPGPLYPSPASPLQFAPRRSPQSFLKDLRYRMQRQDRPSAPQLAPPVAWAAPRGRSRCRNRRSGSPGLGSERELTFIVPAALRQARLVTRFLLLVTVPNWKPCLQNETRARGSEAACLNSVAEPGFKPRSAGVSAAHVCLGASRNLSSGSAPWARRLLVTF